MEFSWTTEHTDLRDAVRKMLADRAPVSRARELAEAGERHDPGVWEVIATQLGLPGLAVPEEFGGSGGSLVDLAIVMEEMGAVLHGGPFLPTAVLSVGVLSELADVPAARELLESIASGRTTSTVAAVESDGSWAPEAVRTTAEGSGDSVVLTGSKHLVLDGAEADVLLVLARTGDGLDWFVVDGAADHLVRTPQHVLDGTRPMAVVEFAGTPARRLSTGGAGGDLASRMLETASILLAAEQAGAAGELVRRTAEYATTRHQFGRPIGGFQGVKHRLADMQVRLELARSAAYWAAWQQPGSAEARLGALVARSYGSDGILQTAKDAIQLHGGIGFTWEHDAHLYLRRARADATLLGSSRSAREALLTHVTEGEVSV